MSLNGARLKIVRADEHLDCLKIAIADYEAGKPYSIKVGTNHIDPSADITEHPQMRIGTMIGDCLQNLNSALDYVMWEIAGTFAGRILQAPRLGKMLPISRSLMNPATSVTILRVSTILESGITKFPTL